MVVLRTASDSFVDWINNAWHIIEPIWRLTWGSIILIGLLAGYFQMKLKKNKSENKGGN